MKIMTRNHTLASLCVAALLSSCSLVAQKLPDPQPIPVQKQQYAPGSLTMQSPESFAEVKSSFPMAAGPFEPTWNSINERFPVSANWLREAKFGIWVHYGPQAAGESGDWYARKIYQPGTTAYQNHLRDFGHPSETGYIDVLHKWNPKALDPARLAHLYKTAGARFLVVQGVHHDNFDNWNSKYQPWNSVNIGPHRDLIGEWAKASRSEGVRFGVAFHHEYTWWWYQPAFASDTDGPKKGIPYDGHLTLADGKGKWWQGYDPALLYGIDLRAYQGVVEAKYRPDGGIFQQHLDYANWYVNRWALRILDVVDKYDPDFIYTDGDSTQPFSGDKTGTGIKSDAAPRVVASFYNRGISDHGKLDKLAIIKFHKGTSGVINTVESKYPKEIKTDQPWLGENAVGDWFWHPGIRYDSRSLITYMIEVVSRDGAYAVNIPIRPDGSLDPDCERMLTEVGSWMTINSQAIYGSHAWTSFGEGDRDEKSNLRTLPGGALGDKQANYTFGKHDFRFTVGKDGALYAFALDAPKPGEKLEIHALGSHSSALTKPIRTVTLLGSNEAIKWTQKADGLEIIAPAKLPEQPVVTFRVE